MADSVPVAIETWVISCIYRPLDLFLANGLGLLVALLVRFDGMDILIFYSGWHYNNQWLSNNLKTEICIKVPDAFPQGRFASLMAKLVFYHWWSP